MEIEYRSDLTGGVYQTLSAAEVNDGSFDWYVDPGLYLQSTQYEIRVSSTDVPAINDGSDAGRSGLRQLKDSFRPVAMHAEFRASQR